MFIYHTQVCTFAFCVLLFLTNVCKAQVQNDSGKCGQSDPCDYCAVCCALPICIWRSQIALTQRPHLDLGYAQPIYLTFYLTYRTDPISKRLSTPTLPHTHTYMYTHLYVGTSIYTKHPGVSVHDVHGHLTVTQQIPFKTGVTPIDISINITISIVPKPKKNLKWDSPLGDFCSLMGNYYYSF